MEAGDGSSTTGKMGPDSTGTGSGRERDFFGMPNGGNSGRGPVLKECSKLSGSGNGPVSSDGVAIGSFGPEPVGAAETGSTFGGTDSSA